MLKLVLIGAGAHSRSSHAPSLAKYVRDHPGRIKLAAVCDLDIEKARFFQKKFGFQKVYQDFEQMILKEKPGACICVLPIHRIVEVAIKVLQFRVPILLEKPPGANIEETSHLVTVARSTGVPNMVSANRRFDPCLRRGVGWARQQGFFRYVRSSIIRHQRCEPEFMWATAFHCVDTLREIAGEIANFEFLLIRGGQPTWFHLDLKFRDGSLGSLDVIPTCGCTEEKYEIFGRDFRAEIWTGNCPQPGVRCWRKGEITKDERLPDNLPGFIRGGSYAETEEFINALLEDRTPQPSVEDVLPSAEICSACLRNEGSTAHHKFK